MNTTPLKSCFKVNSLAHHFFIFFFSKNLNFVLVVFFWQVVQLEGNDEAGVTAASLAEGK